VDFQEIAVIGEGKDRECHRKPALPAAVERDVFQMDDSGILVSLAFGEPENGELGGAVPRVDAIPTDRAADAIARAIFLPVVV
jgi:hypothetical protein